MSKSAFKKYSALAMLSWFLLDATASLAQTQTSSGSRTVDRWSGFVIADASYSDVASSWVVPQIDCSSVAAGKQTAVYAWVGLGGYGDDTMEQNALEQIGTAQLCNGTTPIYVLYYEFMPMPAQSGDARYPLSAGDTVSAKVSRNFDGSYTLWETATAKGANSPKWTFSTTGSSPLTSISDPGNRSAEIVMEQPGYPGDPTRLPVASYGSITFFNLSFTKASTAADHATSLQFYEPNDGNTAATQWAIPFTLSPTSFIVFQL